MASQLSGFLMMVLKKGQVEELAQLSALDFDVFYVYPLGYETRKYNPKDGKPTGPVLVITTDGKGVVMHQQDLRKNTRKAAQKKQPHMKTRISKGEKKNAKRMATVAAVYTVGTVEQNRKILVKVIMNICISISKHHQTNLFVLVS